MSSTVRDAFDYCKSGLELNKTFQDEITTRHNAVRNWIESVNPSIETKLIGSLQRQTRIQPRSNDEFDIDILVVLGKFYSWVPYGGVTPYDALSNVENIVSTNQRYNRMGPETDSPAVSIEYANKVKVELIPAYVDNIGQMPNGVALSKKGGYWIPKNNQWVIADYDYDEVYISIVNKNTDGLLIPTIKILKAIKRKHFPNFKSYYLEILAANILPGFIAYKKERNEQFYYPQLVWAFFLWASSEVKKRIVMPGSNCSVFDGNIPVVEAAFLSSQFDELTRLCGKALLIENQSEAIGAWRDIIGEPFPGDSTLWLQEILAQGLRN